MSLAGSLALAAMLLAWADEVAGARLLVVFLCGVAVWITGNELPTWLGPELERPALMLLATAALTSAVFFHFTQVFTGTAAARAWLAPVYGLGLVAMLVSMIVSPGSFHPFAGVERMAVPNAIGWTTSVVWALLAAGGQLVLLKAALRADGLARRQIAAVSAASAWGLVCMSGYAIAALDLPLYPWPLLLLPTYPVILVYGILRYRVFVANAWARRALVWTMLTALALLVVAVMPLLPLDGVTGRVASGALIAVSCLTLAGPARRLAEQLVYPGGIVSAGDLTGWHDRLSAPDTRAQLAEAASAILSQRLGVVVGVAIAADGFSVTPGAPALICQPGAGGWQSSFSGWAAAPPGPRRVAEIFGAVLAEEAARLDRAALVAERERARQTQARLAELGQLAAAVAHDVRNPLNIIGMAAAAAAPEIRQEIRVQVDRIAHLSRDLLDYARPWQPEPAMLDLGTHVRAAARHFPKVEIGGGFDAPVSLCADPRRLDQALTNLLDNAQATGGRFAVAAEASPHLVRLHVCDSGPGVPEALRERIFEPFVSRSTGGTGLGLAIVARIMEAHGGTVGLTARPGWTTCVTLAFPRRGSRSGFGMSAVGHVLLVDDEPAFQRLGAAFLRAAGHRVSVAGDAAAALEAAHSGAPDVVLLDLAMPPQLTPEAGLALIGRFAPALVIVLTGHADHALALRATELGAWDFLAKPADPEMLGFVVSRAVHKAQLDAELRGLRARADRDDLGLIGRSAAMQVLRDMVRRLGPASIPVVVLGPTGTGKELVARALHACSKRAGGPFVPVHCGALPAALLESELFGHLKGSFTGAHRDQPGLIETAHRGTLFLDEVGEMPPPMQVKLLRFLQEGTYVPVGGRVQKRADVRIVAATHRDLDAMVAEGGFREDFFYRLKGMVLRTPALAERVEDVGLLAARFLRQAAPQARLGVDALAYLAARAFPGNVRELRSIVEAAAALAPAGAAIVDAGLLRFAAGEEAGRMPVAELAPSGKLDVAMAELETRLLRETLAATGGNQSEAARRLGVSRVGLVKKLNRLGLR